MPGIQLVASSIEYFNARSHLPREANRRSRSQRAYYLSLARQFSAERIRNPCSRNLPNERFIFAKNSDEQVFGIDLGHAKLGCLVAGEEHGYRRTFCETLKHGCPEVER
jgi:transposase